MCTENVSDVVPPQGLNQAKAKLQCLDDNRIITIRNSNNTT